MRLPLLIGDIPIIPIDFSEPSVTVAMRALSLLGTIPLVTLATLVLALVLFWRRQKTSLITLAVTVCGGELIGLLLKWLFLQPRPRWPNPLVVLTSASFPSGHAMRSLLFFGLLSYFVVHRIGSRPGRVGILLASGALVLMIGVSRVYLEAHTINDVLAGYAAGMGWLGCVTIGIAKITRNRQNQMIEGKQTASGLLSAPSQALRSPDKNLHYRSRRSAITERVRNRNSIKIG